MPDADERFFIDTGDMDPFDREDGELDAREERARALDDARHEACSRHYPNPSPTCPACGAP